MAQLLDLILLNYVWFIVEILHSLTNCPALQRFKYSLILQLNVLIIKEHACVPLVLSYFYSAHILKHLYDLLHLPRIRRIIIAALRPIIVTARTGPTTTTTLTANDLFFIIIITAGATLATLLVAPVVVVGCGARTDDRTLIHHLLCSTYLSFFPNPIPLTFLCFLQFLIFLFHYLLVLCGL